MCSSAQYYYWNGKAVHRPAHSCILQCSIWPDGISVAEMALSLAVWYWFWLDACPHFQLFLEFLLPPTPIILIDFFWKKPFALSKLGKNSFKKSLTKKVYCMVKGKPAGSMTALDLVQLKRPSNKPLHRKHRGPVPCLCCITARECGYIHIILFSHTVSVFSSCLLQMFSLFVLLGASHS